MQRFIMAATLLMAVGLGLFVDRAALAQDSEDTPGLGSFIGSESQTDDDSSGDDTSGLGSVIGSAAQSDDDSAEQSDNETSAQDDDDSSGLGTVVGAEGQGDDAASTTGDAVTAMPGTGTGMTEATPESLMVVLLAAFAVMALGAGGRSFVRAHHR